MLPYITRGSKVLVVIIAISVVAKEWRYDLGPSSPGWDWEALLLQRLKKPGKFLRWSDHYDR